MKYYILLMLLHLSIVSIAQNKRDYIWMFGGTVDRERTLPGREGNIFDFNNKPIKPKEGDVGLGIHSNNVTICDREGNLLFNSNGCAVLNAEHKVMPHGDSINPGRFFDLYWKGECNFGYPGFQNIIILTDPANVNGYYILHKPLIKISGERLFTQDMLYTYVDMTLDGGKGDVVEKNIVFYKEEKTLSDYLTAIKHSNGKDWWIIQPLKDTNIYLTFLLNSNGIKLLKEQQIGKVFHWNSSASGTARFSPNGRKYALYNDKDGVLLFDFDRKNGALTNYKRLELENTKGNGVFCSVEWSPNSRFIYTASRNELYQVDTWEEEIEEGVVLIDTYDGTTNIFSNPFFLMALAPDCRIYMCSTNANRTYHIINSPNRKGLECDFVQNGLVLPYSNGGSMPNHPRWRVDEEEKCDSTIASVFGLPVYTQRELELYPNPTKGHVNIIIPEGKRGKIEIKNYVGVTVIVKEITQQALEERFSFDNLPQGVYYIDFIPKKNKEKILYSAKIEFIK